MVTTVIEANESKIPHSRESTTLSFPAEGGPQYDWWPSGMRPTLLGPAGVREGNPGTKRGEDFWLKDQPMGLAGFCLANHGDREGDLCGSERTALPSEHPPR